jgi:hypothetical protein
MLDAYTYQGSVGFMTFTGMIEHPIAFNLVLAPWVDPEERDMAAKAIMSFLADTALRKLEIENGNMSNMEDDDDECD